MRHKPAINLKTLGLRIIEDAATQVKGALKGTSN
jgi:hypothetical protein